jgi:hypothetical protein
MNPESLLKVVNRNVVCAKFLSRFAINVEPCL